MMNVAARASETILNKVFDVCIWRIVLMLVDVCIYAFLGNAELFHQFVRVGRLMPRSAAAEVIFPEFFLSACSTISRSTCSRAWRSVVADEDTTPRSRSNSRSFAVTRDPLVIITPRFTRFCSSRTFPGHE